MKKLFTWFFIPLFFATSAFANEIGDNIVLKFRGLFSTVDAKQSSLPAQYTAFARTNPQSIGKMYSMGYGGEAAVSVFLNDYFAGEFTSGLSLYRAKSTTMKSLAVAYNNAPSVRKKRNLYAIPSSLTVQYHVAPFGAIRPYVGGGYHYTYMLSKASEYKVQNGSGPVLQAGIDFISTDETYFNIDLKQYFLKTKIKYNRAFISDSRNQQINSKLKMDPLSIGLGIGFKL